MSTITANMLFNPKFYFWLHFKAPYLITPLGPNVKTAKSPDGLYDVYFEDSSFLGFSYGVSISRKFYQKPKRILSVDGEDEKVGKGPLDQGIAVVWSQDNRYAALIWYGWYVDCYDFEQNQRFSLPLMLCGEVDAEKMSEYHKKVQQTIGFKTIQLNFDK